MTERPELDQGAMEELDGVVRRFKSRILNIAEKKVLDDGREAVLKTDIGYAQEKTFKNVKSEGRRKLCIRLLFSVASTLLSVQLAALYGIYAYLDIQGLAPTLYAVLAFAVLVVFTLVVVLAAVYRDDWR